MKLTKAQLLVIHTCVIDDDPESDRIYFPNARTSTVNALVKKGLVIAKPGPMHGATKTYSKLYHFGRKVQPGSLTTCDVRYSFSKKGEKVHKYLHANG